MKLMRNLNHLSQKDQWDQWGQTKKLLYQNRVVLGMILHHQSKFPDLIKLILGKKLPFFQILISDPRLTQLLISIKSFQNIQKLFNQLRFRSSKQKRSDLKTLLEKTWNESIITCNNSKKTLTKSTNSRRKHSRRSLFKIWGCPTKNNPEIEMNKSWR